MKAESQDGNNQQCEESGRKNPKNSPQVKILPVDLSRPVEFINQAARDQKTAQSEEELHSQSAVVRDLGESGDRPSDVTTHHRDNRDSAPSVQGRNPPVLHAGIVHSLTVPSRTRPIPVVSNRQGIGR